MTAECDHKTSHDPKTKQQIKDLLYGLLYTPIQQYFKNRLDALIIKNTVLGGFTHKSFIYKNTVYSCDPDPLPRKMNKLLPQLYPEMQAYLGRVTKLNKEELPYVLGFINQVLNSSNNLHDYLRVLPEAVHGSIKHIISNCPCHTQQLSEEDVQELIAKNSNGISLMKQRMVSNLLF